ncbi:MAG: hypothetical protein H6577_17345 [Lewinellaceae bacterium]|nr:hypothetical protein [Saprospiraceae bacterium]MCB9339893.1 hypothetical protein [Lewinellaceae bacterium]
MKSPLTIFFLLFLPFFCKAQEADPYEEKYQWRLRQDELYGVYIPKDINEVFLELNKKMDEPSKTKFKAMPEDEATSKLFFSFGRWMTYNWSFYDGSRLSKYIQGMGIYDPEDMARFLIIAYHRSLNRKPLEIKELVKTFQEKAELKKKERLKKGIILYQETHKRDSLAPAKNGQR